MKKFWMFYSLLVGVTLALASLLARGYMVWLKAAPSIAWAVVLIPMLIVFFATYWHALTTETFVLVRQKQSLALKSLLFSVVSMNGVFLVFMFLLFIRGGV